MRTLSFFVDRYRVCVFLTEYLNYEDTISLFVDRYRVCLSHRVSQLRGHQVSSLIVTVSVFLTEYLNYEDTKFLR